MIEKIKQTVGSLKGTTLGVLGLAFKPNTDDIREAVSINIIRGLLDGGASVRTFDPAAMDAARGVLEGVTYCKDAYDAAEGADALILVTEWNQFRNLDLERLRKQLRRPVFIDLRNVYEPKRLQDLGFKYACVGRLSG